MNNSILLKCKNICKIYKEMNSKTKILHNCNFFLSKGEMATIVGSSGSGKSTLLHILGGLDIPTSGDVIFNGQNINKLSYQEKAKLRNKELGFIYQFHHLLSDFTALENIAMPLLINNMNKKKAKSYAYDILISVDMENKSEYFPSELSGGERQRVAIARALVNNPSLVLADEPTGNLDVENTNIIFNLMKKFNKIHGTAFLIATHDTNLSKQLIRKISINNGKLCDHFSTHNYREA